MTADHVGCIDRDLAVEAARAQQRRVEDVGTVGGRDQDDVGLDVEAVHLDQQLVEGLLALVVTAAETGATVAADGVDLVDEDDGRGVGLGLLEQVPHPRRADTDEHLDEVRAGDRVERHAGLTGNRAGEQGLAGAGRAVEQDALGDLGADREELGRLGEELLDLEQLLDGLIHAGDVGEGDLGGVLVGQLGLALAELHDLGAAALHLAHQEPEQTAEQDHGEQRVEQAGHPAALGVGVGEALRRHVLVEGSDDLVTAGVDVERLDLGGVLDAAAGVGLTLLEGQVDALVDVVDLRAGDLVLVDQAHRRGRVDLLEAAVAAQRQPDRGRHEQQDQPHEWPPQDAPEIHGSGACAPSPPS